MENDVPVNHACRSVLDHGFVRLVASMGNDLSIVRSARVSYDAAWRAGDDTGSDKRLIHYLLKNHHTTPFESVEFQFEVYAPIFDFRQWHRHRMWSYNELSARYRELPEVFYVPQMEMVGIQATKNKQARSFKELSDEERTNRQAEVAIFRAHCEQAFKIYRKLLERGWPRELARAVLPLSTYSHMFAKVDLHNLFHFLRLRLHSHAQYEIRVYAEAMFHLIENIVPTAVEAFKKQRLEDESNSEVIAILRELRDLSNKHKIGTDLGGMIDGPDGERITELENRLDVLAEAL